MAVSALRKDLANLVFQDLPSGRGRIGTVTFLAMCQNFGPWYSAYWFPLFALKYDSLLVGEFPVAWLCDTVLIWYEHYRQCSYV